MSELTDYERERLERIAKNQELLQSLQIDKATRAPPPPKESKPKPKRAPRARAAAKAGSEDGSVAPIARATRSNAARTVALEHKDPEAAKRKREQDEEDERQAILARKRAKHGDREIETWNPTGSMTIPEAIVPLKRSLETLALSGSWKRAMHSSIKTAIPDAPTPKSKTKTSGRRASGRPKKEESDDEGHVLNGHDDDDGKEDISVKQLQKTFEKLSFKAMKRITPDRVYSLAVHPTEEKDLVFIGDRKGWFGIWNASDDQEEDLKGEDDEEDEYDRHAFVHRVYNDHGTISCLRLDPIKSHTIYAGSYDCTIRSLNFEKGVWHEEVDIDLNAADDVGEGEALVSGFEVTHDGNVIWASDNGGGVTRADLREPKEKHERWRISESKAGCISLNPANENYFVTAHLNRDLRLWDARKLLNLEPTNDYGEVHENACVASFDHGKACSSAYFDPSGKHLLSTSYDDYCRIWNVNPKKLSSTDFGDRWDPDIAVPHDNATGAYVSVFKATWSSNPIVDPYFTIGNMKRRLDIYSKEGKLLKQLSDGLNSVPAVTCGHPSLPVIFGGAAGGKVYYWKADRWA